MPVIIGALRTLLKGLNKWLVELNMAGGVELIQKICVLGTAKILRKFLIREGWKIIGRGSKVKSHDT